MTAIAQIYILSLFALTHLPLYLCVAVTSFPVFQVTEGQWTSQKLIDVLSLKIPANFTPDPQLLCDFITNFETRRGDVFVVSYAKSG